MANESISSFGPSSGFPETGGAPVGGETQPFSLTPVGTAGMAGAGFPDNRTSTMLYLLRIPNAAALATGMTFTFTVTDDTLNPPSAGGLNSYWGVTVGPVVSGTSTPDESIVASSTEDKVAITHGSTIGTIVYADLAAVVAHMNGLAAGGLALIRLRRLGSNALDTHNGRVVLLRFDPRNT